MWNIRIPNYKPILINYETITVTRRNGRGKLKADGSFAPAATTQFQIQASIQPFMTADSQFVLPEGVDTKDIRIVYTQSQLRTADEYGQYNADSITIDGVEYDAYRVGKWRLYITTHDEVMFIRRDKVPPKGTP